MDSSVPDRWVVCRSHSSYEAPDGATLSRWAHHGRIRPDDYLVSERRDLCLRAIELPELSVIFDEIAAANRRRILQRVVMAAAALAALALSCV